MGIRDMYDWNKILKVLAKLNEEIYRRFLIRSRVYVSLVSQIKIKNVWDSHV